MSDLGLLVIAVVFVAINGLTMLAWAAAQGYKMKPTAFAYLIGAVGNLLAGSITPISGNSSILTISHFIKNMNERIGALLIAVVVMTILGLTGAVTQIADFAGQPVLWGMMAGVGIMITGISFDMWKQEKRTGTIAFVSGLATHVVFLGNQHSLVYVIAVSVTLATIDFAVLQKDPETGKRGRRIDLLKKALADGYTGDMEQNENPRFWTKEYWDDFKIMAPTFNFNAVYFALAFICLNIGTNIAFANINAGFTSPAGEPPAVMQNLDHLTIINGLADVPSIIFGGAPVGAIISATAASPWPVMAGVLMMTLCAALLLLGLMTKAVKYVPIQAIAGFLFIIGFFSTFVPNLRNVFLMNDASPTPQATVEVAAAMAVTALTKNPFLGLMAGISVRYVGGLFFIFL